MGEMITYHLNFPRTYFLVPNSDWIDMGAGVKCLFSFNSTFFQNPTRDHLISRPLCYYSSHSWCNEVSGNSACPNGCCNYIQLLMDVCNMLGNSSVKTFSFKFLPIVCQYFLNDTMLIPVCTNLCSPHLVLNQWNADIVKLALHKMPSVLELYS